MCLDVLARRLRRSALCLATYKSMHLEISINLFPLRETISQIPFLWIFCILNVKEEFSWRRLFNSIPVFSLNKVGIKLINMEQTTYIGMDGTLSWVGVGYSTVSWFNEIFARKDHRNRSLLWDCGMHIHTYCHFIVYIHDEVTKCFREFEWFVQCSAFNYNRIDSDYSFFYILSKIS